ncbi:uncharacterized protein LOC108912636 isoform X2 [Anoplophora glabripennis]|uniref:uncharacterized protein LOC108912636 isoform X2 n=1 Tax=Anoplophora glabripennis TaxID=217634 RepID=UPI0008751294|nr:uncharacterized protein LOC108912636 isoform X2 [Anoplophora glabripennis]
MKSGGCRQWAINCGRMDLLKKTTKYCHENCKLCGWHFEDVMFLNDLKNRLQRHAVPTRFSLLPGLQELKEEYCDLESVDNGSIHSMEISSNDAALRSSPSPSASTQTSHYLSSHTPHKLSAKVKENVKSNLTNDNSSLNSLQNDIDNLKELCDKLLPSNLSSFIKFQIELSKKNKYSHEYRQFVLTLYYLSPQAYNFLTKTFALPSVKTLRTTQK